MRGAEETPDLGWRREKGPLWEQLAHGSAETSWRVPSVWLGDLPRGAGAKQTRRDLCRVGVPLVGAQKHGDMDKSDQMARPGVSARPPQNI